MPKIYTYIASTNSKYNDLELDLSKYALKSEIPSIDGLATEGYVLEKINEASLGGDVDLSDYVTEDELEELIPNKLSELENDCKYVTEDYVKNEINDIPVDSYSLSLVGSKLILLKNGISISSIELPSTPSLPDNEIIPIESITLNSSYLDLNVGDTIQLEAEVNPSDATNKTIIWNSNNNNVATVSDGLITAVGSGECVITASCDNVSTSCHVNVTIAKLDIPCTGLSLDESAISLKVDSNCDRMILIPKVTPKNSTDEIIWSSDNSNIAKVDSNGIVTSVAGTGGTTTIRVTCGNQTATCRVTVQTSTGTGTGGTGGTGTGGTGTGGASAHVTAFDVLQDEYIFNTLNATDSQTITPFIRPATSTKTKTYKSTDTDVATVDKNGTIIPKGEGECLVYACCGAFVVSSKVIVHVPKETYSSPNITVENFKAKVEQDGHIEYFDLSYEPNTGHPYYTSYKELADSNGTKYYLSLLNKGTSKFRINGLIPSNGGWMSLDHSDGNNFILTFNNSIYAQYNNWDLDCDIQIKNNSIDRGFVQHALDNVNASLDDLNIKLADSSKNSFELANYNESWIGLYDFHTPSGTKEAYFEIMLNKDVINDSYGQLDINNKSSDTYKYWLSTSVHEFGHFLGIRDNSMHLPTMYSYSRDLLKCNYLQPNDIYVIKHFWKDLFNKEVEEERVLSFEYPEYSEDKLYNKSDVVVNANLKLIGIEDINVGNGLSIPYNIYEIYVNETERGTLTNNKLKIYVNENLTIDENKEYKLYLKQYDNVPCSLININQGIKEI